MMYSSRVGGGVGTLDDSIIISDTYECLLLKKLMTSM